MNITRRNALGSVAALPLAAAALGGAAAARADGHAAAGPVQPRARGVQLGDLTVTALLAGTVTRDGDQQGTFGMNVDAETFAAASEAAMIPTDRSQFFFTPTLVEAGDNTILFDTGLNAAGITEALAAAGKTRAISPTW